MLLHKLRTPIVHLLVLACSASMSLPAHTGTVAGFGGGTEITQLLNNGELVKVAVDSAETAMTTVQSHIVQIEQYRNQLLNTMGVDPAVLAGNIADANKAYNTLRSYQQSINGLTGSLSNQLQNLDSNQMAAKLMNMSWKDYVLKTANDARLGNERAKLRIQTARSAMEQVDEDYKFVQEQGSAISAATGQHESIKILNNQMNRLVQQNARMVAMMARAESDVDAKVEAANDKLKTANEFDLVQKRQKAIRAQQLEMMQR